MEIKSCPNVEAGLVAIGSVSVVAGGIIVVVLLVDEATLMVAVEFVLDVHDL